MFCMAKKKKISIIIPVFNEELNIPTVATVLTEVTNKNKRYHYEFIYVDNGSQDHSREIIQVLKKKDNRIRGVFLSRNFGPEASAQAGFDQAHGDAAIGYACDMQDPAELILEFISEWEMGADVVTGVYTKLEDNFVMSFLRRSFYRIFKTISSIDVPVNSSGYGLTSRKVLDAMKSLPEKYRFYRGLRAWVGFKTVYVTYVRRQRQFGKSSYNLFKYFKHAERSFFGFSYVPLDFLIYTGFILVFLSFIALITFAVTLLPDGKSFSLEEMIFFCMLLFGGIQLLALSIVGKYIQVIVEETKSRPTYIIERII